MYRNFVSMAWNHVIFLMVRTMCQNSSRAICLLLCAFRPGLKPKAVCNGLKDASNFLLTVQYHWPCLCLPDLKNVSNFAMSSVYLHIIFSTLPVSVKCIQKTPSLLSGCLPPFCHGPGNVLELFLKKLNRSHYRSNRRRVWICKKAGPWRRVGHVT